MKRTAARELAVQLSFYANASGKPVGELIEEFFSKEYYKTLSEENELFSEYPEKKQIDYISRLISTADDYRIQIDRYIAQYAQGWKTDRISKTAMAILRCAVCEIMYMDDIPASVAINEAVELAKAYDEPETAAFVNGVLGGFMRGEFPENETEAESADE